MPPSFRGRGYSEGDLFFLSLLNTLVCGDGLREYLSPCLLLGTDISQKDEKPSKKRQNQTRDGKVCEDEAQSKSSQLREEKKAKKN
ncbi:hypothetical protein Tco_1459092, partial [Tanacetum coccineum]